MLRTPQTYDRELEEISHKIDSLEEDMYERIDREQFDAIRKIVYGMMFFFIIIMLTTLISLVVSTEWWRPIVRAFK